jgi:uncharacterized protein YqeY
MANLADIESDVHTALKARDSLTADTLRGLKTRIQNEQIAQGRELSDEGIEALVASEVKRRKEAAQAFTDGGRGELAEKEMAEAAVLQKYLPAQVSEDEIRQAAQAMAQESGWSTKKDFGPAMAALKAKFGASADSGTLAKILQELLA